MNTAIDVKQLSVTLGDRHILHDINVSVPVGKITTLIGPNGCGKSTLLRSMIGYIHSPRECVTILGKSLQSYSQNELARQMAFLPQVPNMPKDMTVEELVYCGRYPYQTWWKNTAKEDREIVDYALGPTAWRWIPASLPQTPRRPPSRLRSSTGRGRRGSWWTTPNSRRSTPPSSVICTAVPS